MKRIVSMILAAVLLISLSACGMPAEKSPATEPTSAGLDAELRRAYDAGLMPEAWLEDLDGTVTFQEYSAMTTRLVQLWDASRVPEWEETVALASESDEEMTREDGILMLSYAWVLLGRNHEPVTGYIDETVNPNILRTEQEKDQWLEELSWDYPLFPDWDTTVYDVFGANYIWGGVMTFVDVISPVTGQVMFTWDEENSLHLQDDFVREDAVRAIVRMADYCKIELDETWRDYIPLAEVGSWNRDILPESLLERPTDLPEVTQAELPSTWKGAGLSSRKNDVEGYRRFDEAEVKFLADTGFNFTRLFFDFETLRYPDYPEDVRLVNRCELEDLDRMLSWCVENGIHLQISMSYYLDEDGHHMEQDMPRTDEEWAITRDYWAMLSRRYSSIPSTYLTFDLCNEVEPSEDPEALAYAKAGLEAVVEAVRAEDPERVLLYSLQGNGSLAWTECIAELGIAVGYHPYWPSFIAAGDFSHTEQNPYAQPCWPQPYFPMGLAVAGEVPIVIQGDVGGSQLSFHINTSSECPLVSVYGDGALLETFTPTDGTPDGYGEYVYGDSLYTLDIPAGTEEVTLWVGQDGHYARLDTILVEKNGVKTVMVPSDTCDYPDYGQPLPLIIQGDGTYTNSENRVFDEDFIYENKVKPYRDIAQAHGVGFMVNEFGMYGTKVYWDIDTVTAFHETYLRMMEKYNIGWCYCEAANTFPKHLIIPYGNASQWSGATVEEVTYTTSDGQKKTLTVCTELWEVFRRACGKG